MGFLEAQGWPLNETEQGSSWTFDPIQLVCFYDAQLKALVKTCQLPCAAYLKTIIVLRTWAMIFQPTQ